MVKLKMGKIKILIQITKDIWRLLSVKRRKGLVCLLFCAAVSGILEMMSISLLLPFVNYVLDIDSLRNHERFGALFHGFNDTGTVFLLSVLLIICFFIKDLILILIRNYQIAFANLVQRELSVTLMKAYISKGYLFFTKSKIHELCRGIGGDIDGVRDMIDNLISFIINIFTLLFLGLLIAASNIVFAAAVIVSFAFIMYVFVSATKKKLKKYGKDYQYYNGMIGKYSLQAFKGIKEILVNNKEKYFIDHYNESYRRRNEAQKKKVMTEESAKRLIEVFIIAGTALFMSISVLNGNFNMMLPQLAIVVMSFVKMYPTVYALIFNMNALIFGRPALEAAKNSFHGFDVEKIYETDYQYGKKMSVESIKMDGVKWIYPDTERVILDDVCLTIKKGDCVAIIGESGAGKTTIADMMLGLYKPVSGDIKVNNISIYKDLVDWLAMTGYVAQDLFLAEGTIRQNVAFGICENDIDEEKVWDALDRANLSGFIKKLDGGLDTWVGENGIRLSGGQRQRIAIARVLYKDPEFIIFDEATSALDTETEEAVMESILNLKKYKTMIIIAHRLSTIENCDRVYEIKDGKLINRSR